jgi:hypothetical protein
MVDFQLITGGEMGFNEINIPPKGNGFSAGYVICGTWKYMDILAMGIMPGWR